MLFRGDHAHLFQIISAQQLPKPEWDKPSSIVDPQVWVEIHGVPIDNMKKKTHHVENNGKGSLDLRISAQFFRLLSSLIYLYGCSTKIRSATKSLSPVELCNPKF